MKKYNKIVTIMVLALLVISSTFLVFSNSETTIVKASIPSTMLQYEWPQSAVDSSRSNFNSGPGPTTPYIEWRTEIPYLTGFQPVAFNGMVFVEDALGSTYALDAATGKVVYTIAASGSIAKIDGTYMLIGSRCYRIADGSLVWTGPSGFSHSTNAMSGIGYTTELKMLISGSRAWSLANPAQPPTLLWDRATESDYGAYGSETAINCGSGIVVYSTVYNYIRGVDAQTGKTLWTTATTVSDWVYGASVIDGVFGRGDLSGTFYGWNITTGELMWTYNPGTFYNEFASSSGAAYGMFYEKNEDTHVYAINATTGELVWKYKGPGIAYSNTLSIADGKVYAMTGENQYVDFDTGEPGHSEFACLDAFTGEVIWTEPWENGPPFNYQCNAYGKLFIVPTQSHYNPGIFIYRENPRGEVWCIGDTPKDWSMFLGDAENSGFGDGPTNLALKWKTQTGGVVCSPALVNGVAYVESWDGNIYAFNADTGKQIWNYSIGMIGMGSMPAVVNGKLYTGADDGNVYCLDAATGAKQWEANAGGVKVLAGNVLAPTGIGSPTVVGDRVYVAAANRRLYCFNALSGAVIWTYNATGDIEKMTPTVVDDEVYFGANGVTGDAGPHVIKLNATTGEEIFNVVVPGFTSSFYFPLNTPAPVTLGGDLVFARCHFRYNYALNATTGEIVWMVDARYNPGTPGQAQGNQQSAPMLYKYGIVYMTDFYGITALNALDGSELWHTYLSRENSSPGLSYSYGRVYTVNEAGGLYVLEALTGEKLSFYQLGHTTLKSVPTPYNGSLYLGSRDWNLYCFEEAPPQPFHGGLPTSTSVAVAPKIQALGATVLFEGKVLAQSMDTQTGIPVKVHLTAIDPNNNYQDIANATCNERGFYSAMWIPPVPGLYVVTAKFEGDQFFLPSAEDTAFVVSEASTAAQSIEPEPVASSPAPAEPTPSTPVTKELAAPEPTEPEAAEPAATTEAPLVTTETAIIAVVAVACAIGVVSFWALKKRK